MSVGCLTGSTEVLNWHGKKLPYIGVEGIQIVSFDLRFDVEFLQPRQRFDPFAYWEELGIKVKVKRHN